MAINIRFLEQFEKFLRQEEHTIKDKLIDLANTNIVIHYKKLIDIACRNYKERKDSTKLYNCLVRFLMDISCYKIELEIILDGTKPKILADLFETDFHDKEGAYINPYYSYRNYGVAEIIQAVKVLKDANYKHNYYFAPFEATPQVYYLHDQYMASSMCAYPDLLMYAWYNFIIDIDIENGEFEWVKYSKENKLNEKKNLAKVFINFDYFVPKGSIYKPKSMDKLRDEIRECNNNDDYNINNPKYQGPLEVIDNPWIMSIYINIH